MVIFKDKFTKVFSKMHPETFDRFSCENVKKRKQIGKVSDKYTDEQIQSAAISYDIPKCYRYCLSNPLSPWMFPTYNDIWEAYSPKMGLPYGLYDKVTQSLRRNETKTKRKRNENDIDQSQAKE